MDGLALLGIFLIFYSVLVVWIAVKKPEKLWDMAKIRMFRKLLGEQGTVVLFYVVAAVALVAGVWLMVRQG